MSKFSFAVMKRHDQKQLGMERVYFILTPLRSHSITEESQGRKSKQALEEETEAEALEKCCLLSLAL